MNRVKCEVVNKPTPVSLLKLASCDADDRTSTHSSSNTFINKYVLTLVYPVDACRSTIVHANTNTVPPKEQANAAAFRDRSEQSCSNRSSKEAKIRMKLL